MLTEKEIDFTVKEIIKHAIGLISEFGECEEAVVLLEDLLHIVNGSQEKAKSYWFNESEAFGNDLEETLRYLCSDMFEGWEIRKSIFTKVLT